MTHDRCSELLRGYVRNELPRDLADEVRGHLAACDACRAEERAVAATAVTDGADARPLDDMERARLHRGLAQELFTPGANDVRAPAPASRRWARWIVPATTAAAVLAGVLVMTQGGGMDADVPESAAVQAPVEDEGGSGAADAGAGGAGGSGTSTGRPSGKAGTDTHRALSAAAGTEGAQAEFDAPQDPLPVFDADRGVLTSSELTDIAQGGHFRRFALSYRPKDASDLYDGFLDLIASEADDLAPRIAECAATLPQDSLIPAYATTGEYRGNRVLVLGFVSSDYGARLNRVLIWAWKQGDCDEPVETLFQKIGRR